MLAIEKDGDALEAAERFEVQRAVADREVAALDELDAELAGEQDVLEPGGVAVTFGEQRDAGLAVAAVTGDAAAVGGCGA